MHAYRETHFTAAKRVLRYIKGTNTLWDFLTKICKRDFEAGWPTNSDWVGCVDDLKTTSGYIFSPGTCFFS